MIGAPAIGAEGTVYFGSHDGSFYALRPDGTLKWNISTGDAIESYPAIGRDGTVYFGSDDHKLYAIGGSHKTFVDDFCIPVIILVILVSVAVFVYLWNRTRAIEERDSNDSG